MSTERSLGTPRQLSAVEAGELLGLPPDVVRALSDGGYLADPDLTAGSPRWARSDVKAFQARHAGIGSAGWGPEAARFAGIEPEHLLGALDGRAREMAERTFDLLVSVFPLAAEFTEVQRERFIAEAHERIEAILTVCASGPAAAQPLEADLAEIGADAAHAGIPLPGILAVLRVSRDLMVQTAVEVAEQHGRQWGVALTIVLTRVVPVIDRLGDAIARGYWEAVMDIEAEGIERYRNVIDAVGDGVAELDADGVVRAVNPALAMALGSAADELVGQAVEEVLGVDAGEPVATVTVDGASEVRQIERVRDGIVVGWDAVVSLRRAPR